MVQKFSLASPSATRGRPRKFDTDEVLGRARDVFWRNGYAGTSMDQIANATGLHKPSLYGAFGDKKQLYLAALNNYLAEVSADFAEAIALPTIPEVLQSLTDFAIDMFLRTEGEGMGCFMMNTALAEVHDDPEISRVVREAMDRLDRAIMRRFEKAADAGELSADANPRALAMIVIANHYDISARARAGYSREDLRALADQAIGLVKQLGGIGAAR